MPWYLYLALKQLFPSGKKASFFTVISVAGVMLGVALLVIVLSVMNGFGNELRSKVTDTQGHIRIEESGLMYDSEALLKPIRALPEVAAAASFARGVVMLQYENKPWFPAIQSVEGKDGVVPLGKFLVFGNLDDLDDDSVFLGSELAYSLGARVGGKVDIYSPLMLDKMKNNEVFLPRAVRIAGIFQTGWTPVDSNTVVGTLRLVQDLYGLEAGVHGIAVRLKDGNDTDRVIAKLSGVLPEGAHAVSWMESNRDFLFVLRLEMNVMFFLLIFIEIVAAFAITSSLLTAVVRKTREIGLLGALGATSRQVALCFCFQSLLIGVVGTILGVVGGLVILYFRNNIIHGFAHLTHSEAALMQFYQFSNVPSSPSVRDFLLVTGCSLVISMLAGLLPALRASKLKPVEALRSE